MSADAKTRHDLASTLPGHAGMPIVDPGPNAAASSSRDGLHNGLARRGEGEKSVHLPSGMNERMNDSFIDSFQKVETVDSVLLRFGVFALSTAKRESVVDLCRKLDVDGAGPGRTKYLSAAPCRACGGLVRYTSSCQCVACAVRKAVAANRNRRQTLASNKAG